MKIATCSAASDGPSTEVGKKMVMLDGSGRPRAVIETGALIAPGDTHADTYSAVDQRRSWRRRRLALRRNTGQGGKPNFRMSEERAKVCRACWRSTLL